MGYVGPFYPKIAVFSVLDPRGNLVILSFAWAYKKNPRGMGLLATSPIFNSTS
jgi:hypothetical protein